MYIPIFIILLCNAMDSHQFMIKVLDTEYAEVASFSGSRISQVGVNSTGPPALILKLLYQKGGVIVNMNEISDYFPKHNIQIGCRGNNAVEYSINGILSHYQLQATRSNKNCESIQIKSVNNLIIESRKMNSRGNESMYTNVPLPMVLAMFCEKFNVQFNDLSSELTSLRVTVEFVDMDQLSDLQSVSSYLNEAGFINEISTFRKLQISPISDTE